MSQWFSRPGSNLVTIAKETGYPVKAVRGWETRGHGGMANTVKPIVCHHTAGPEPERTASNYPSFYVVRDGRAGLPGPLSQYGIGFDGTIYVFAAGLAYHAGTGSWRGWHGNSVAIGIEAEDGGDGDWLPAQLDVYPRLVAVICQFLGVGAEWVCGHKEWTSRKIDPAGINMTNFRSTVDRYLKNPHTIRKGSTAPPKEEDMSEVMDWLKREFRPFTLKDDAGKEYKRSWRQAVIYGYQHGLEHRKEGRTERAAIAKAIAANAAALKALAAEHQEIQGLSELVADLDESVDQLASLPLATALVLEDEAADEEAQA